MADEASRPQHLTNFALLLAHFEGSSILSQEFIWFSSIFRIRAEEPFRHGPSLATVNLVKCSFEGYYPKAKMCDAQGITLLGIGVLRTHASLP